MNILDHIDGMFCCFGFLTLGGLRNQICSHLVYFPPHPSKYVFEKNKIPVVADAHSVQLLPTNGEDNTHTMWVVDNFNKQSLPMHSSSHFNFGFLKTRKREKIAFMWIGYRKANINILFSHANATDLGFMREYLLEFSNILHVNVFAYDYSGYGLSSGKASPSNTYADVEAAYQYLVDNYPAQSKYIIAYGQSLGSGPTLYLAGLEKVDGVVIHSGLMSGLRVIKPQLKKSFWFDVYPNIEMVKLVKAPIMVIHGTADQEIPIAHGQALSENAPNPFRPWYVEGGQHNDIETRFRHNLFNKLVDFIQYATNDNVVSHL